MAINFNPALTTSPQNTFLQSTDGYVQGVYFDDPTTKNWLTSGVVGASVTQPIWGGMAITEEVATVNANALGNTLVLATSATNFTGFTVFNQANNMIIAPGNSVQIAAPGMTTNFFGVGSRASIAVAVLASLVTSLEGGAVNQPLFWDPALQQLTVTGTAGSFALPATTKIRSFNSNSKIVSYNSGTGAVSWTTGNAAIIQI